ncbi:MAG: hypothetical protein IJ582_04085 [Prevotella sp.]|nr:hypothetical protein [Prevotella sp.]
MMKRMMLMGMKSKLFITMLVLGCCTAVHAQSEVLTATLTHGDQVSVFTGTNAFVQAHEAAADGDVISLSSGSFAPAPITKSVTVYGAGYEKNAELGIDITLLSGDLNIGVAETTLSNVHIEGVKISGLIKLLEGSDMEGLIVKRCYTTKGFTHYGNSKNTLIQECIFTNGFTNDNTTLASTVENLSIRNCYVYGNVDCFGTSSTVLVENSLVTGFAGGYVWKNCILPYRWVGAYYDRGAFEGGSGTTGATVVNCIIVVLYGSAAKENNVFTDCYVGADYLFNDSPGSRDYSYSATRTFELRKDDWLGTDGTEVGMHGGSGWSKVPSIPVVKSLDLNVEGSDLKVTYEAEVR